MARLWTGAGRSSRQEIPRPAEVQVGDPAPWAGLGSDQLRSVDLATVRSSFAAAGPPIRSSRQDQVGRGAAVLAAIYEDAGESWLVLTRRSAALRVHSGEVSFPGGGQEPDEDLQTTALREAHEEVALDPGTVEIFGELDHLSTFTSNSFIVPYVAALPGRPRLVASPDEVDEVLLVSFSELLDPTRYREERWDLFGTERPIFFFELAEDTLWGATAAMVRQLLGLATGTVDRGGLQHL